jgi:uncharacterized protein YjbI with pentapeptide repeats
MSTLAEDLVGAINESAQHLSAATLTFLATCVYIAIAVATTTHEMLLMRKSIGLPLLNAEIPLDGFYFLAPLFLVFLHLHVLLLTYLLQRKIERYVEEPNEDEKETDLFFSSLPLSVMLGQGHPGVIRLLLLLLLTLVTVIMPVSLLVATQIVFLPSRSLVTIWHAGLIALDVWLVWYFARRIRSSRVHVLEELGRARPRFARERTLSLHIVLGCTLLIAITATAGIFLDARIRKVERFRFASLLFPGLSLTDQVLLAKEPSIGEASPDNVEGLKLTARNLRQADFYNAKLINADFRGADLTNAVFRKADLRGANFSPYRERTWAMVESSVEREAVLRELDLREAQLDRAKLPRADLRGAQLDDADLRGADLSGANLEGAHLRNADLRGADLTSARLVGADLWRAKLEGAKLQDADIRLASFVDADATGVDFARANTLGADFRDARLYLVEGMHLDGVDFRDSKVGEITLECGEGNLRSPRLSDLRGIDFRPLSEEEWGAALAPISKDMLGDKVYAAVFERIKSLRERSAGLCLLIYEPSRDAAQGGIMQIRDADLLYEETREAGPMAGWPDPEIDERRYYESLAKRLVNDACEDLGLASVMVKGIDGGFSPGRPELVYRLALRLLTLSDAGRICTGLTSLLAEHRITIERIAEKDPIRTE